MLTTGIHCDETNGIGVCKCTSTLTCAGMSTGEYCADENGSKVCKCSSSVPACKNMNEVCNDGKCKCGDEDSCEGNPAGSLCTGIECKCTQSLASCSGNVTGEYCDESNSICKCGGASGVPCKGDKTCVNGECKG